MIDLKTGNISLPASSLTITPFCSLDSVLGGLQEGQLHKIQDARSGHSWYGLKEKVYETGTEIPIWLCFNGRKRLESVELYPQFSDGEPMDGWPADAQDSEQKYCYAWLQRYCGLYWEENGFPWGTICNDYDSRSDSCGIVFRYTGESERREE